MSEMVNRVAKALSQAEGPDDGLRFERMALAALEAMHEPTETMCQAGLDTGAVDNDEFYLHPRNIETVYVAMIDEALK